MNVLLIGGSKGIGRSLAVDLANSGNTVYVLSRTQVEDYPGIVQIEFDVKSGVWPTDKLPEVLHGFAYLPGSIRLKPFHRLTEEDLLADFDINVMGAVKTLQHAYPLLKASGNASVVLFSTVAVGQGMTFHSSISASKGAIEGLAKSLAAEWAPVIRVNVIAPSLTDTPLAESLLSTAAKREAASQRHPLKRVGSAGDISSAAKFLLSGESTWISGQVLGVDGGLSSLRM